jgi:hypothetical protein
LIVTLEKTKEWIRVESNDEDALIESFIAAAEDIVSGILRFPLSELSEVPETVNRPPTSLIPYSTSSVRT